MKPIDLTGINNNGVDNTSSNLSQNVLQRYSSIDESFVGDNGFDYCGLCQYLYKEEDKLILLPCANKWFNLRRAAVLCNNPQIVRTVISNSYNSHVWYDAAALEAARARTLLKDNVSYAWQVSVVSLWMLLMEQNKYANELQDEV